MPAHPAFSLDEAAELAAQLGLDLDADVVDLEEFRMGLDAELDHGSHDPGADVAREDSLTIATITLEHLRDRPDYYTRLARMIEDATETD